MSERPIVLIARKNCKMCHGSGIFYERHGPNNHEPMECDCAFDDIPEIFEIKNKIENGNYVIIPHEDEPA